jgi:hypothetical protein
VVSQTQRAKTQQNVTEATSPRAGEMQAFFDRVFGENSQFSEFMAF